MGCKNIKDQAIEPKNTKNDKLSSNGSLEAKLPN